VLGHDFWTESSSVPFDTASGQRLIKCVAKMDVNGYRNDDGDFPTAQVDTRFYLVQAIGNAGN